MPVSSFQSESATNRLDYLKSESTDNIMEQLELPFPMSKKERVALTRQYAELKQIICALMKQLEAIGAKLDHEDKNVD